MLLAIVGSQVELFPLMPDVGFVPERVPMFGDPTSGTDLSALLWILRVFSHSCFVRGIHNAWRRPFAEGIRRRRLIHPWLHMVEKEASVRQHCLPLPEADGFPANHGQGWGILGRSMKLLSPHSYRMIGTWQIIHVRGDEPAPPTEVNGGDSYPSPTLPHRRSGIEMYAPRSV